MPADDTLKSLFYDLERGLPPTRIAAAQTLGEYSGSAEVLTALRDLVSRDAHPLVRLAGIESLGRLEDHSAVSLLAKALSSDPDDRVRLAAARGLGKLHGPEGLSALAKACDTHTEVGQAATDSLTMLVGKEATAIFLSFRQSKPRETEQQLKHLQSHGTPEDLLRLFTLSAHPELLGDHTKSVLQAVVSIIKRHPEIDSRPLRAEFHTRALLGPSSDLYQSALRELDAASGSSLPIPSVGRVSASHQLPRVAGMTPSSVPAAVKEGLTCDVPAPIHDHSISTGVVVLASLLWTTTADYAIKRDPSNLFLYGTQLCWLFTLGCLSLIPALKKLPQERVEIRGRQLHLHRRFGPFHWTRTSLLDPNTRVLVALETELRPNGNLWRWKVSPHTAGHLAVMGAGHRPFRFAHGRSKEELERLASEINLYLDAQSEASAALSAPLEPQETESQKLPIQHGT